MPAITTAGPPRSDMDYERLILSPIILAFGLVFIAAFRVERSRKRRLRARGVEVAGVRTGRKRESQSVTSYEVQFTPLGDERMTTWTTDPSYLQVLVYDRERPPVIKRLGPIRHLRHGPIPASSLRSTRWEILDWSWLVGGLLLLAVGVVGLSPIANLAGKPSLTVEMAPPYAVSPLDADAEVAARNQFRTSVHTATADADSLLEVGSVVQITRDEQRIGHVVLAIARHSGIEVAGERRDINGTAVIFTADDLVAVVRLENHFAFIFGIDTASTREIAEAVVAANP